MQWRAFGNVCKFESDMNDFKNCSVDRFTDGNINHITVALSFDRLQS